MRDLTGAHAGPQSSGVPGSWPEDAEASDETLMERIGAGDARAYQMLITRHLARNLGFAHRLTGSGHEAEDVVQEAFLRVWKTAGRWRPGGAKFTTWFYRVVMNLCIDRRRRARSAPLDAAGELVDPAAGAEEQVRQAQRAQVVAGALTRLPERQRAAIALCYYQELSNREAADVLGVSVKALEALLVRARQTLRQDLAVLKTELMGETL
jgi:RNA polymerase sigma-70 factor (ECF subfamily)